MGDNGSTADSSSPVNEKGSRNKRKFLSDTPVQIPTDTPTLSLTEFPRYEMIEEKLRKALTDLGSFMRRSKEDTTEEQEEEEEPIEDQEEEEEPIEEQEEEEESQQADWNEPIACQLEELLTENLLVTFRSAVKKIVECGYTPEAAEWAILNSGLFHGSKDAVSNVVDGALALLKGEKEINTSIKSSVFEGLRNLADYTMIEMIHVLRQVQPELTIAEAMWCLLITDLNLLNACVLEGGSLSGSSSRQVPGESSNLPKSKVENFGTDQSDSNKVDNPQESDNEKSQPNAVVAAQSPNSEFLPGESTDTVKESSLDFQEVKGKLSAMVKEHTYSHTTVVDEKVGGNKKGPSSNSKRDMLRQKALQLEKSYKGRISKAAFKAKVAAWGSMVLDKSPNSQSVSSSALMKETCSNFMTPAGTNGSLVEPSSNSQSGEPTLPDKDSSSALPKSPSSSADADPNPNCEMNVSKSPPPNKAIEYNAAIPYDETLQKYIPRDIKEKTILTVLAHKEGLEKDLQGWTDWANKKVMQAARRLGKDRGELKILRREKEDSEKSEKERQTLEENTMKRLSEMEHALLNATRQIEIANSTVHVLGEENILLKKEMEATELQSKGSAAKLQEAVKREQEALRKCQLWDTEKACLMEKQKEMKRQSAELKNRMEKAKGRQDQFKVLKEHEEKENLKVLAQIEYLKAKREEDNALTEQEAENIRQAADSDLQNCKEDIKDLEKRVSELRLESEKSKIAALTVGYGSSQVPGAGTSLPKVTKRLAVFQDNFGGTSVKPERECVMCMSEEISVVFLPCAHQVLCGGCSAIHEKQGMNDCPSCRTPIKERIAVRYRGD